MPQPRAAAPHTVESHAFDSRAGRLVGYRSLYLRDRWYVVNELTVPLASITADGVLIDAVAPTAQLRPRDAEDVPADYVGVRGTLSQAGQEYLFQGTVSGRFARPCDRCLVPTERAFQVPVVWVFKPGPRAELPEHANDDGCSGEEVAVCSLQGNEVDLAPEAWTEVVLAMPAKFLCREDCAGLCPRCGVNLNHEACACRDQDQLENKGFAGLADRFPDLKPKGSKE